MTRGRTSLWVTGLCLFLPLFLAPARAEPVTDEQGPAWSVKLEGRRFVHDGTGPQLQFTVNRHRGETPLKYRLGIRDYFGAVCGDAITGDLNVRPGKEQTVPLAIPAAPGVRQYRLKLHLIDGSYITGEIKGQPLWVEDGGVKYGPFVLNERSKGEQGQSLKDLVYVKQTIISRRLMQEVLQDRNISSVQTGDKQRGNAPAAGASSP